MLGCWGISTHAGNYTSWKICGITLTSQQTVKRIQMQIFPCDDNNWSREFAIHPFSVLILEAVTFHAKPCPLAAHEREKKTNFWTDIYMNNQSREQMTVSFTTQTKTYVWYISGQERHSSHTVWEEMIKWVVE